MKRLVIALLTVSLFIAAQEGRGQEKNDYSLNSYNQARQLIEKSLSKMGFGEKQVSIQNLIVEFEGEFLQHHQAVSSAPPYSSVQMRANLTYNISKSRISYEDNWKRADGYGQHFRRVRLAKGGTNINFWTKTVQDLPDSSHEDLRVILDRLPHLVLQRILERPTTLRWGGRTVYNKTPHNIVFATSGNSPVTLFFDEKTSLLSKYEFLVQHPFEGDIVQEGVFDSYRQVNEFMFPTAFQRWIAGTITQNYRLARVEVNSPIDENLFVRPAGFQTVPFVTNSPTKISQIAPGAFLLEHISQRYNILFVEFDKFILVGETPLNSSVCERAIDLIKKHIPNKPIRYVVPTHHHDDHAGGLRAFIAEGATIITTPKNKTFFESVGRATFTLQPDRLAKNPRPAVVEVISNKKHVFSDGKQKVEIYDIGAGPHAEEMLVIYLPESGILFQADLLNISVTDLFNLSTNETTVHFAKWLKDSKLNVKQILGVHLMPKPIQEFEEEVQKFKVATAK